MANICKTCIHWNKQPNTILLPNGEEIVQQGFIADAGGSGFEIAKCIEPLNTWSNITRDVSTITFFDSAAKRDVMEHAGILGAGENDTCSFYSPILVTEITVTATGGVDFVDNGGTLQMLAAVLPIDAVDTSYTWSVINGTGSATIDMSGLLTATSTGTVTVRATANDAGGVYGEMVINVVVLVTAITVSGFGGATTVANGGTLQMLAAVLPLTATNPAVEWSVVNGTGVAIIDEFGLLTAGQIGTVTVTATAVDGSGVSNSLVITVV